MRISDSCAKCLFDKQANRINDEKYLEQVRNLLVNRKENDTAPYMIYLFDQLQLKLFRSSSSYRDVKKHYNDYVLEKEDEINSLIQQADDPLLESLKFARIGNYIDFGAMNQVDIQQFTKLLKEAEISKQDNLTYQSFIHQCKEAKNFLLITDNCGEIVLDKLFLQQLHKRFPHLKQTVLVRGKEIINDATREDAQYIGIDQVAEIIDNGEAVAGTIFEMLPEETKQYLDNTDVILSKGQGNYESLSGTGKHIFYSFLCKCDLFTQRFQVPLFTGLFLEER